jgi:hypothetical protein
VIKFPLFPIDILCFDSQIDGLSLGVLFPIIIDDGKVFVVILGMHSQSSIDIIDEFIVMIEILYEFGISVKIEDVVWVVLCLLLIERRDDAIIISYLTLPTVIDDKGRCGIRLFVFYDNDTGANRYSWK